MNPEPTTQTSEPHFSKIEATLQALVQSINTFTASITTMMQEMLKMQSTILQAILQMLCLKICFWNANGIRQHKNELEYFLMEKQIDVMMIAETQLTSTSFFKINSYTLYAEELTGLGNLGEN